MASKPRTLYEKIWDEHVVERRADGTCLIFIDRHLVHEVTSPQAFEALRMNGRKVRHPELTLAVPDHNLPTTPRLDAQGNRVPIADPESRDQLAALERNAPEFGVRYFDATSLQQGIVHVVGPEQGFTLPGTTLVCGDSHTAAHGALGALAFGIGTSEVEHVLATQTLLLRTWKTMEVRVEGDLAEQPFRRLDHPEAEGVVDAAGMHVATLGVAQRLGAQVHARVVDEVVSAAAEVGLSRVHSIPSPVTGQKGNVEFLVHFRRS